MERLIAFLLAALLLPFSPPKNQDTCVLRAMLIGSDTFVTQENTYPVAQNNLKNMQTLLQSDHRRYQDISIHYETITAPDRLQAEMRHVFAGCDENDISLIYFSTHGTMTESETGLYLSDGSAETLLSPQFLAHLLSDIPGTKILILDACNSGAFIGKGRNDTDLFHPFIGDDIYVITSASACEASWQWQSTQHGTSGGSYFTALLTDLLSGYHAADGNKDNTVTINEAFSCIRENIASSTPQRYPEDAADFPLYTYSTGTVTEQPAISGLTFDDTLLSAEESDVYFSFTVHRETQLYYQLVYYKEGKWDFDNAAFFHDTQESDGPLLPGRKQRKLSLAPQTNEDSGYVMIQLFSVDDEVPVLIGGRLLCVQPSGGSMQLQVETADGFDPCAGEEMCILVSHDTPCALSVTVRNASGKSIRRLAYAQPTRPLQFPSPATTFYWDGKDNQGRMAAPGKYYIQVQTTLGDTRFTAESDPFVLHTVSEEE